MIDCFITHVWRQSPQWVTFEKFLFSDQLIEWRNFSLPWHDPALKVGSGLGQKLVMSNLTHQITPTDIFFLLESLYEKKSNLFWLNFQINVAKKNNIPIILVPENDTNNIDIKSDFDYIRIENNYNSLHNTVKKLNLIN
tara:strand:+ start:927 stop:1343 length:417 start_codon:yes stop_codon:yes gene_type:complete